MKIMVTSRELDLWLRAAEWLDLPLSTLLEAAYGPCEPRLTPIR